MESSGRREREISPAGASVPDCLAVVGAWNHLGSVSERPLTRVLSSAAKAGRPKKYLREQGRGSRSKAMDGVRGVPA